MSFLEKNLEDIIYENAQTEEGRKMLKERGLDIRGKLYRQVEIGGFGRIDLLEICFVRCKDGLLRPLFIIYELKRNALNKDTLIQACRYLCGVKSHIANYCITSEKRGEPTIACIIIGEGVDESNGFPFLFKSIRDVYAMTFSYEIDGIRFRDYDFEYEDIALDLNDDFGESLCECSFSEFRDILNPFRKPF